MDWEPVVSSVGARHTNEGGLGALVGAVLSDPGRPEGSLSSSRRGILVTGSMSAVSRSIRRSIRRRSLSAWISMRYVSRAGSYMYRLASLVSNSSSSRASLMLSSRMSVLLFRWRSNQRRADRYVPKSVAL